jgi:hypothetical protein
MSRFTRYAATLAAVPALCLLGFAASASASVAKPPPGPKAATLACQITEPTCTEPVAAVAFPSTDDYVPVDDAALTSNGSGSWLDPDNTQGDGSQDWSFANIATVPPPGGGPGAFNFTGFDRHNYGLDGVYEVEWTPFGQDTGKCLQVLRGNVQTGLRACDGGKDQAFIVSFTHLPLVQGPGHPGYVYALSVLQVLNAQHHLCLTGHLFSNTTVSRCLNKDLAATDTQRWSAIP